MGIFGRWLARKGNVGGTARAVALGWKRISTERPEISPKEIAEIYIKIRYGATGEPQLLAKVQASLQKKIVSPLELAWTILSVETDVMGEVDGIAVADEKCLEWKRVMEEEFEKAGLKPY